VRIVAAILGASRRPKSKGDPIDYASSKGLVTVTVVTIADGLAMVTRWIGQRWARCGGWSTVARCARRWSRARACFPRQDHRCALCRWTKYARC
jgi:hypothetical protein